MSKQGLLPPTVTAMNSPPYSTRFSLTCDEMGPIVILIIGYILQIVIAAQGFLSRRNLFGERAHAASVAAWISSIGVVLLGILLPDGGDSHYGSTLQVWLGAHGDNAAAVHAA